MTNYHTLCQMQERSIQARTCGWSNDRVRGGEAAEGTRGPRGGAFPKTYPLPAWLVNEMRYG